MNILYLSAFCPSASGDNAAVVDAYYLLQALNKRHNVTVITFISAADRRAIEECRSVCDELITVPAPAAPRSWRYLACTARSFLSSLPAIAYMSHSAKFVGQVRRVAHLSGFDVVHVQYTQLAHYVEYLEGLPAVLEEGDLAFVRRERFAKTVTNPIKRFLLLLDTAKLKHYEIGFSKQYDGILVRSEADRATLSSLVPERPIASFPPWVDLSLTARVSAIPTGEDLMFYGAMWRPVNEQAVAYFAQKIFPQISTRVPQTCFVIAGSRPSTLVRSLANARIEVTGFVDDIAPIYSRAAVVVAPLLAGSGIKGKVIQALAYGRPVVTTSIGAEGIPGKEADGLFVCDNPRDFAECVLSLLHNKSYLRYCKPAQAFIRRYYDWTAGVVTVEQMYQTAIQVRHAGECNVGSRGAKGE